jgi:UbiA prenyltransferase family
MSVDYKGALPAPALTLGRFVVSECLQTESSDARCDDGRGHSVLFLMHIWMPVLAVVALTKVVAQVFPHARYYPAGAWSLYLGVLLVYTGDRLAERGRVPRVLQAPLWGLVGACLVVMGYFALRDPGRLLPVEIALGVVSVIYGTAKNSPVLKTVMVTATWVLGCTFLPYDLLGDTQLHPELLLHPSVIGFAFMFVPSALLCDFKDQESDARAGVRSLPVILGARGAQCVSAASASLGLALSLYSGAWAAAATALLMLAVTPWLRLLRRPLLGPLVVDGLLAVPGLLLWL